MERFGVVEATNMIKCERGRGGWKNAMGSERANLLV